MADVFEARHVELGKRVAVKILRSPLGRVGADSEAMRRVLREGRAATAVHHPNVVAMLDVGFQDGIAYLVMELLDGEDLSVRLAREGPLPVDQIADLLLPVISGMTAAHAAGVIHRDLKPSNIFLARRHHGTEPVVVDFGISKSSDGLQVTGSSQTGAGTLPYMAPEQVRGSRDVTARCDQYALGVILYECATGGTPFWSEDRYDLLHAIMTASVVPPSELNPRIGPSFDAIVLRALARDPGARFPDVVALGAALWPLATEKVRAKWAEEFGAPEGSKGSGVAVSVPPPAALVGERRRKAALGPSARIALALAVAAALGVAAIAGATLLAGAGAQRAPSTSAAAAGEQHSATTVAEPSALTTPPVESAVLVPLNASVSVELRDPPPSKAPSAGLQQPIPARTATPAPRSPSAVRAPADSPPPRATVERGTANIPIVE
jgi:serine/threonine-protein kinase